LLVLLTLFTRNRWGVAADNDVVTILVMTSPQRPALASSLQKFFRDIWTNEGLNSRGVLGGVRALWRVLTTSWYGIWDNQLPQRSAALTYYTLMSLGPVLALGLTVSGFILSRETTTGGENPAKRAIVAAVEYIAPQVTAATGLAHATLADINRDLDALVDRLLANAADGGAGAIGLTLVIGLAVLMLSRVEDTLNGIWGVARGRSWRNRFANYCLFLVLFFLVGAASLTVLSVAAIVDQAGAATQGVAGWIGRLPGGVALVDFLRGSGPEILTGSLLAAAFACLYRLLPNARVRWSSALVGGITTSLLIIFNHELAAAYVGKVVEFHSLYGQLSIVPVMMFGGYVSWLIVLAGGQVAFAFQHRRAHARHRTWEGLSHRARRSLAFICVAESLRCFRAGKPAPTADDLSDTAHIPTSVVDVCLHRLHALGLLAPVNGEDGRAPGHAPARPLEQLTLGELWLHVDSAGQPGLAEPDFSGVMIARELENLATRLLATTDAKQKLSELA
jgi:membrane protein